MEKTSDFNIAQHRVEKSAGGIAGYRRSIRKKEFILLGLAVLTAFLMLADAYFIGTVLYPAAFADADPAEKFDQICQELLGVDAYDKIAEAYFGGYQKVALSN